MELFRREQYLSKIRGFYHENDIIKVITGADVIIGLNQEKLSK